MLKVWRVVNRETGFPLSGPFLTEQDADLFRAMSYAGGHDIIKLEERVVSMLDHSRSTLIGKMLNASDEDWSLFKMFWDGRT